jgi:hypothetical protein
VIGLRWGEGRRFASFKSSAPVSGFRLAMRKRAGRQSVLSRLTSAARIGQSLTPEQNSAYHTGTDCPPDGGCTTTSCSARARDRRLRSGRVAPPFVAAGSTSVCRPARARDTCRRTWHCQASPRFCDRVAGSERSRRCSMQLHGGRRLKIWRWCTRRSGLESPDFCAVPHARRRRLFRAAAGTIHPALVCR